MEPATDHARHAELTARLPGVTDAFAGALAGADPDTPVPTCPGWTVTKLAKHVGLTQRWAAEMVRTLATERIDQRTIDLGWPDDPAAVPRWLRDGAADLAGTLDAADPDAGMWAWGADQHVRFWSRRMVHEGLVHTADLRLATGATPGYPADLAVDAVDELLDNIPGATYFAPKVAELRGDGESIHLHSTDGEGEWMIDLTPDGFRWQHAHGKGTVAVRGPAAGLVLLLYRRLPLDDEQFTTFGERSLIDHWLEHSAL
jgi:uncharacterized protein (TIGR03083 family)